MLLGNCKISVISYRSTEKRNYWKLVCRRHLAPSSFFSIGIFCQGLEFDPSPSPIGQSLHRSGLEEFLNLLMLFPIITLLLHLSASAPRAGCTVVAVVFLIVFPFWGWLAGLFFQALGRSNQSICGPEKIWFSYPLRSADYYLSKNFFNFKYYYIFAILSMLIYEHTNLAKVRIYW